VESLGCGRWLRADKLLADTLQGILGERQDLREPAVSPLVEIASRLDRVDAPAVAAAEIEKLMREKVSP
jgi:hypothetical protein